MKPETDPIADDEWLLRRVRVEKFRTDAVPVISPNAFEPRVKGREPDADGISLYRESCLADPLDALATVAPERRHEYGIVRVPMRLLAALGLTARSRPDDRVAGHVVIPELNAADYAANRAAFTSAKYRLAVAASDNVVHWPASGA